MDESMHIFVLTGAGISAESGIPVFQGTSWRGRPHAELANIHAWNADPELVWEYYSERRRRAREVQPNAAHFALANFAESLSANRFFLCTQNVDGLHEAAGSKNVFHVHGCLFETRCADECGQLAFADTKEYAAGSLPRCVCGALQRPNVCWFGEQPYELDRVQRELDQCSVFLAVGTSGSVQPVASFVAMLKQRRGPTRTMFVGLERPANASYFDDIHLGKASAVLAEVLRRL